MVKKRKKKNAITLLALVITIVIMLLLAGVAIQMTMGENGLIAKSVQAQKEQAKAELYDTAKLSYMSLNAKALENGQPSPEAELALSTIEFRDRYDIVGDDVTDKNGTVIDTKLNVLNVISGLKGASGDTEISMKGEYVEKPWPKKVAGVTIPEEDKDKMILKVKVLRKTEIKYVIKYRGNETETPKKITNIEYGNGISRDITDYEYGQKSMEYEPGEYIVKIKNFNDFTTSTTEDYEIEILQWGNITEKRNEENSVEISNVSKIYEPEPDKVPIRYINAKFTEIPEWLFSKKVTSKKMSGFVDCKKITNIPENLFKNCVNAEEFEVTFKGCTGITSIPENIFKYNTKLTDLNGVFMYCNNITNIPENIFKYNTEVREFNNMFDGCSKVTSIPENLFKYNTKVIGFSSMFINCPGITSIPENLFKYNTEITDMLAQFYGCTGITSIPENLFKYNTKVDRFSSIFEGCTGLTNIPEDLFKYNTIVGGVPEAFSGCSNIRYIPDKIIEIGKKAMERAGTYNGMLFKGCTSASNYSSIPGYLK